LVLTGVSGANVITNGTPLHGGFSAAMATIEAANVPMYSYGVLASPSKKGTLNTTAAFVGRGFIDLECATRPAIKPEITDGALCRRRLASVYCLHLGKVDRDTALSLFLARRQRAANQGIIGMRRCGAGIVWR
jgi:hypothetical protein